MTPFQQTMLGAAGGLVIITFMARMMVAEARAVRLGPFMYVLISGLVLLLFYVVAEQSAVGSVLLSTGTAGAS